MDVVVMEMKQSYIYLAGPYSHWCGSIRARRFEELTKKAGELMKEGLVVYSPITHGHMITVLCPDIPLDFDWWQKQSLEMLSHASTLMVLKLEGWEKSKGVGNEIIFACELEIPVEFIEV